MRTAPALIALPLLTACTTEPKRIDYQAVAVPESQAGGFTCVEGGLDRYLGQRATASLGAEIRRVAGADRLRWIPPHSAVTMDHDEHRVSVSYDESYRIIAVRCG